VSVSRGQVRTIALSFPGANAQLRHGGTVTHFYIGRKFFTWIREEENSLVVGLDSIDERDSLMESDPGLFHITAHYRNWPFVLVRLDRATPSLVRGLLERRFRKVATRKLVAAWDADRDAPSPRPRRRQAGQRR
jgi:hypothetical protein